MAATGQGSTQAPQSMHSSGLMTSIRSSAPPSMMQSTGQTSTHDLSFRSTQVSVMMYAIAGAHPNVAQGFRSTEAANRGSASAVGSRHRTVTEQLGAPALAMARGAHG